MAAHCGFIFFTNNEIPPSDPSLYNIIQLTQIWKSNHINWLQNGSFCVRGGSRMPKYCMNMRGIRRSDLLQDGRLTLPWKTA